MPFYNEIRSFPLLLLFTFDSQSTTKVAIDRVIYKDESIIYDIQGIIYGGQNHFVANIFIDKDSDNYYYYDGMHKDGKLINKKIQNFDIFTSQQIINLKKPCSVIYKKRAT
jgi:hypothetical protein